MAFRICLQEAGRYLVMLHTSIILNFVILRHDSILFPRRDKKGLHWTPLMTVPKKFHYFSNLKNVFKTWFWRPINDLIELGFLWFYMCFCKKNQLNSYFETLYGLFSFWWPNRVIIWYFEPKKPKISVFWGIVCFVVTFLQVLISKITRKTTWKNHKKDSTG